MRLTSLAMILATGVAVVATFSGTQEANAWCIGVAGFGFGDCGPVNPPAPKATLTTAPIAATPAAPAPAPVIAPPSSAELSDAATKINNLAITGVITSEQASQALKLVASGGGNLVASGAGNLVASGAGNLVASGAGNLVASGAGNLIASNALALSGAGAVQSNINAALISQDGGGLVGRSAAVQQNVIMGFYEAGKITDTQASALSKLVASGGGNVLAVGGGLVASGAGNLVASGAGNLVASGAGNLVASGAGNLVASGAGNFSLSQSAVSALVASGAGNLVASGAGNLVASGAGNLVASGAGNLVASGAGNLVASGGGNSPTGLVASGAGNLVASGAGNLVASGAGNLVASGAGNLVASGAGNLVASGAGNLVASGAGNIDALNGLLATNGGGIVSAAGLAQRSVMDVGEDKGAKVAAVIATTDAKIAAASAPPPPTAAQLALTATQNAAQVVATAADLVKRDRAALDNAIAAKDQNLVGQYLTKLNADTAAANQAVVDLGTKAAAVAPADSAVAQALFSQNKTIAAKNIADSTADLAAKVATVTVVAAYVPTAAETKALNDANAAALAAKAVSDKAFAGLSFDRPADPDALKAVNQKLAVAAISDRQASLAKAQAGLADLKAKGASAYEVANYQRDVVDKAQKDLTTTRNMADTTINYSGKAVDAQVAQSDLANAKAAVAALTQASGGKVPTDAAQLAIYNSVNDLQKVAQDRADQTTAIANAARLTANGASAAEIKAQNDISAAKQSDISAIVAKNPLIAAGVANPSATLQTLVTTAKNTPAVTQTIAALAPSLTTGGSPAITQALAALTATQQSGAAATADVVKKYSVLSVPGESTPAAPIAAPAPVAVTTPAATPAATTTVPSSTVAAPAVASVVASADLIRNFEAATAKMAPGETGLADKLSAKLSPAAMQQLVDVMAGKGTISGAAGAELTSAMTQARNELAATKVALTPATTPAAPSPAASPAATPVATAAPPVAVTVVTPAPAAPVSADLMSSFAAATAKIAPGETGLAEKLAGKLSPAAMQQLVDVMSGKGTISGAAGAELTTAMTQARSEIAATNAATAAPAAPTPPATVIASAPAAPAAVATAPAITNGASPQLVAAFVAATKTMIGSEPGLAEKVASKMTPDAMQNVVDTIKVRGTINSSSLTSTINEARAELTQPAASAAAPVVVATAPAAAATPVTTPAPAAATAAPPAAVVTSPVTAAPNVAAPAPAKITVEQNKAVQQALRTIPGKLSATEQKTFDTLSTLVDRAVSKGLTPDEAATLKAGLSALATKNPKAEQQHKLRAVGEAVAVRPAQTPAAPVVATTTAPQAVAPAPTAVAKPPVASAPPVIAPANVQANKPPESKPAAVATRTPPVQPVPPPSAPKPAIAAPPPNVQANRAPQPPHIAPKAPTPVAVVPRPAVTAPRPNVPVAAGPRPVVAAPRPAVAAPKPPTCTPNIVNGKVTGMTCH